MSRICALPRPRQVGQFKRLANTFQPGYFTMQSLQVSNMPNLYKPPAEIGAIRDQIARAAKFRGYGPATLAAPGALALVSTAAQSYWVKEPWTRDWTLSCNLAIYRRGVGNHHWDRNHQACAAGSIRSRQRNDSLCGRTVSSSHTPVVVPF